MKNAFLRNRTEEFGQDVWDSYILPPYFEKIGLREARKSIVIEGGRGSGKTALLRYMSYQSQFSRNRKDLPSKIATVGLYLKADPQYFSGFTGGGIEEQRWINIFEHALCLNLAEQITDFLSLLSSTPDRQKWFAISSDPDFGAALGGFSRAQIPASMNEFRPWVRTQRQRLSRWFRNFDDSPPPELFPMRDFLISLIGEIKDKVPLLTDSVFTVFVDEYENLLDYQQRILNTMIKGGEPPLIFHIAMKPNGMRTRMTVGTEAIQEMADFRKVSLDDELSPHFGLFAAELFFFRLIQVGLPEDILPVTRSRLQDEDHLAFRRNDLEYRGAVLKEVGRVLPGMRLGEIAEGVLIDGPLKNRWEDIVELALRIKKSDFRVPEFFDRDYPEATIVSAALLHQEKDPGLVFTQFNKLRRGEPSQFKEGDWIHHFLLGTLLLIYLPFRQRPCPVYSGFEAFTKLSKTNVRHFLELCHESVDELGDRCEFSSLTVPPLKQAAAAFRVSRNLKEEVSGCGDTGNRLLSIVNFLGKLFRLAQGRPSQSEPERTHFSIINAQVDEEAQRVLDEAVKWSVLFKVPESKVKGTRFESSDYVLNPIYSPFFGISFNKGRKLEIPCAQATQILRGNVEEFTDVLRQYERQWILGANDSQLLLDLEK
jgi:hypothetical protein